MSNFLRGANFCEIPHSEEARKVWTDPYIYLLVFRYTLRPFGRAQQFDLKEVSLSVYLKFLIEQFCYNFGSCHTLVGDVSSGLK